MSISIFGAPMKYGADVDGLDKSIEGLVKYDKSLLNEVNIVEVEDADDKVFSDKLKHLKMISKYCNRLAEVIDESIEKGDFPLVIGGDHSVSLGSVAGVSKSKNIGLFWIDAHGDFNTDETTSSGHIHGMPLASIVGLGNEELRNCFYDGPKVKTENVVYLGTRDFDDKESKLIKQNKILNLSSKAIEKDGVESSVNKALSHLPSNIDGIHISLDLDVLDPVICPGVSVPVPNGLNYEQLVKILSILFATGKVISMDIVEYNPKFDVDNKTVILLDNTIALVKKLI